MYRNVRQARTTEQVRARTRMQRGGHGLVLLAQGDRPTREVGEVASGATRWWEDLRRGQRSIYGGLFRFIDVSLALGTPKAVLKTIPEMIEWYIDDQPEPGHAAKIEVVKLVA